MKAKKKSENNQLTFLVMNSEKSVINTLNGAKVKTKRVNGMYTEVPMTAFSIVKAARLSAKTAYTHLTGNEIYYNATTKQVEYSKPTAQKVVKALINKYGEDVLSMLKIEDGMLVKYVEKLELQQVSIVEHPKNPEVSYRFIEPNSKAFLDRQLVPVMSIAEAIDIARQEIAKHLNYKFARLVEKDDNVKELTGEENMLVFIHKFITLEMTLNELNTILKKSSKTFRMVTISRNYTYYITSDGFINKETPMFAPIGEFGLILGTKGKNIASLSKRLGHIKINVISFEDMAV